LAVSKDVTNDPFTNRASRLFVRDKPWKTRGGYMKKAISILAVILMVAVTVSFGEETAFNGCKLADVKGKQAEARLIFSDEAKSVIVRSMDRDVVSIPYGNIDKFSYDYAKKHRITQGAIVMVASLGAGAIVMLTKSKSHWLYIDFHEQNAPKSVVLRMDKNEYKKIFAAVKAHTGKDVQFIGEAGKNKDKDKNKDKNSDKDKDKDSFR
jgi:hypothetical protein